MKKALKNKSKKLNKKKRNPQTQTNYVDENNPFCLLGNWTKWLSFSCIKIKLNKGNDHKERPINYFD